MRSYLPLLCWLPLLFGCRVGPIYQEPEMDVPCEWHSPPSVGMGEDSPDCLVWWEKLNDPTLNSLIERAALQNLDLAMAAERILEARAEQKGASSALFPHLDGSMTYGHAHFNQRTLNNILNTHSRHHKSDRNIDLFEIGFDAEWEIDLFGMNKHDKETLKAKLEATEAEFFHIWVTLSAEVAKNYVELRGLQLRMQVLDQHIRSQKDTLKLIQSLAKTGFLSTVDQKQAEEQLHVLLAQKPEIDLAILKAIYRISILLGYAPGELFNELSALCSLPSLPYNRPIGLPSELLRRRPDIIKAERELAAATEQVGSAIAALFPRLSLTGFLGDISTVCSGSFTWFAGSQLLAPLFNSKLLQKDVQINKIKARQALIAYQKTVLGAFEETENAIASFHYELERNSILQQAKLASQETYELNLQLYQRGFKDYLAVLVSARSLFMAEDTFYQSQVDLLLHYISLYKSLGGSWEIPQCCESDCT